MYSIYDGNYWRMVRKYHIYLGDELDYVLEGMIGSPVKGTFGKDLV